MLFRSEVYVVGSVMGSKRAIGCVGLCVLMDAQCASVAVGLLTNHSINVVPKSNIDSEMGTR